MLFFGHRYIENETLYHIFSQEHIAHTPPNALLFLEFSEENLDIVDYLQKNELRFALHVKSLKDALFASALGATYIVTENSLAKSVQNIAETYLFDAKVLVHVNDEKEIEEYALLGIDGVVFPQAIVKVS